MIFAIQWKKKTPIPPMERMSPPPGYLFFFEPFVHVYYHRRNFSGRWLLIDSTLSGRDGEASPSILICWPRYSGKGWIIQSGPSREAAPERKKNRENRKTSTRAIYQIPRPAKKNVRGERFFRVAWCTVWRLENVIYAEYRGGGDVVGVGRGG